MARRPDGSYEFGDNDGFNPKYHERIAREQQERQQAEQAAAQRRRNDEAAQRNLSQQPAQQHVYNDAAPGRSGRSGVGRLILLAVAILVVGWLFSPPSHWLHDLLNPHR